MSATARPLRALFLNEGDIGPGVMGHLPVEAAIRNGLAGIEGVEPRFASLPPFGRLAHLSVQNVPLLARLDLDLQPLRWHAVQAARARRAVVRELRRWPADVLHVNSHTIALALAPVMERVPTFLSLDATVWQFHELAVWRRPRAYSRALLLPSIAAERRALERARLVLAWTDWARRGAEEACPGVRAITHNAGIDLNRFSPGRREPNGLPRVLFVGGRFAEKGGFDLLEAIGDKLGRELELDVVTPAPLSPRPGLTVHRLSGADPRLVELYRRADVFCLPSRGDTMGWVIVEAMACGTPVVASSVGGVPDVLEGGRAGVLVPPRDIRGLRESITRLLADAGRQRELAAYGRALCERGYDARRQTRALVELMRAAVDEHRSSAGAREGA